MTSPAATTPKSSYRPDIDGLRAIAVLSVIAFHIDKRLRPGGFVGVDIFFVISGFLISLNILRDIERGRFSLVDFYRRRVKRIAPPMLLVVVLTMVAAQLVMIPEDAARVAKSALWSLLSLANVYFWRYQDTSYFAAASSESPLLHLWSLGIEEQFYVFWPLLLMLVYRRPRARALFIAATVAALSSFALGQVWFARDPAFVYYMLPTRAGELLLGALVALAVLRRIENRLPTVAAGPIAAIGLLLVVGSFFFLAEDQVFPGVLAIPPTLGAALLILAGHCVENRVSRLLALKPLVWVGLVSYSAYLWHWPLLAFFRYGHGQVGAVAGIIVVVLTFLLAWLTYLLVEQPARAWRASAIRIFVVQYILPAGVIASIGLLAVHVDGYGLRWRSEDYKSALAATQDRTRPAYLYDYVCQRQRVTAADTQNAHCVLGPDPIAAPRVLLWGDSNAAHYIGVVGAMARAAGFNFRNVAASSCPPLLGDPAAFVTSQRLADCRSSIEPVLAAVRDAEVVIISASWSAYQERSDRFLDDFFATARSLTEAGKLVLLIGKAPVIAGYDRRCREKALSYPLLDCPLNTAFHTPEVLSVNRALREFAEGNPNATYFDVDSHLCRDGVCSAFNAEGRPLYYDPGHLSLTASWEIGERILRKDGIPAPFVQIADWLKKREPVATTPSS